MASDKHYLILFSQSVMSFISKLNFSIFAREFVIRQLVSICIVQTPKFSAKKPLIVFDEALKGKSIAKLKCCFNDLYNLS